MACTPTSEFNITGFSLYSDPLFPAASVLLADAGAQSLGLDACEVGNWYALGCETGIVPIAPPEKHGFF